MRGAFGQFWARELAKSPELKSAYADVGKSYSAQRSFRANWAAKEFEACSAQRIREESVETRAGLKARHMSAGRIFVEEGGDYSSMTAASNYVKTCIDRHNAGETGPGNRGWIRWNSFTRRYDFLYVFDEYDETHNDKFVNRAVEAPREFRPQQALPATSAAVADPAGAPEADAAQAAVAGSGKETPKKGNVKGAAKAKAKAHARASSTDKEDGSPAGKTEQQKMIDVKFAKLKALRNRLDAGMITFHEIKQSIESKDDWRWARSPALVEKLDAAKNALHEFKEASKFFEAMMMQKAFANYAKKNFTTEEIDRELSRIGCLEAKIKDLETEASMIIAMHNARAR